MLSCSDLRAHFCSWNHARGAPHLQSYKLKESSERQSFHCTLANTLMSHYPFRHSTYWTGGDPVYTSELPVSTGKGPITHNQILHSHTSPWTVRRTFCRTSSCEIGILYTLPDRRNSKGWRSLWGQSGWDFTFACTRWITEHWTLTLRIGSENVSTLVC